MALLEVEVVIVMVVEEQLVVLIPHMDMIRLGSIREKW